MKRISIKATMSLVVILLLTAACTDELNDRPADTGRAIAFTPAAETRAAVEGSALPSGSSFSVWGWYGTGNEINKNVFDGNTVTESGGTWGYTGGTQYWIPGMTYNFYGVYPASVTASVTNDGIITITNFDCSATGTNAVDLMTATARGDGSKPAPVAMEFSHELARVKVSVESNGATVDELKVYGVDYKGNFSSGVPSKWTVTGTAEENTTPLSGETELDMLLLPTTDLTNAKLKVTYHYGNDASATRTDEASLAIEGGWTAGQQYHYKVSIVAGKLTITVTVVDWNEKDTSVSWG
ncbi:fimbrillin family protein [Phocaeicola barnesiae]|uniref:fimbrillin family protein n=1 Tax=Phocaeicola barnesiae TaxID=376804 RepID=UPI001DBDE023|nr:fimbrillin family protein [Phocaeicola barnesiae]HJG77184.1 fimbrillin family protein [Phocaeicola barnesiae]